MLQSSCSRRCCYWWWMCITLCSGCSRSIKVKGDDQKAGVELIRKALQAPIRQIINNAGVDASVVVGKL